MKYTLLIMAIPFLILSQSCYDDCVEGTGQTQEYEITVNDFKSIALVVLMNLEVMQGSEQAVSITAQSEIFSELIYSVSNQHLSFDFKSDCISSDLGILVKITVPDIERISIEGDGEVQSMGDLTLTNLEIDVSGIGRLELAGEVNHVDYVVEGTLEAENFDLLSTFTSIDVQGLAEMEISCSDRLDIAVEGSADIAYKGQPQISQDVQGTLNLVNAN